MSRGHVDDLDGLVAVVTGGASGIGAATASLLRARGALVAVLDRDTADTPPEHLGIRCRRDRLGGRGGRRVRGCGPVGQAGRPDQRRRHTPSPWRWRPITWLMASGSTPSHRARRTRRGSTAIGAAADPQAAAEAIAFLTYPASASTTGAVLRVDGGMTSLRT